MSFKIITEDCLSAVLDHRPSLIVADPPYNQGIGYGSTHNDSMGYDEFLAWLTIRIEACCHSLLPYGSIWLLVPDEWLGESIMAFKKLGFHIRNLIVWYETFGQATSKKFARTKRTWIYATKHRTKFTFNDKAARVPSDRQLKYNDPRANPDGKVMDDVWKFSRVCGTFKERIPEFPTQLPVVMTNLIVDVCSNPGDTVLDPFSGSATTGVSALVGNRNYIGVEINPEYAELSRKRLLSIPAEALPSTQQT